MNSGNHQHSDLKIRADPAEAGWSRMTPDPSKGLWICMPARTQSTGNTGDLTLRYTVDAPRIDAKLVIPGV